MRSLGIHLHDVAILVREATEPLAAPIPSLVCCSVQDPEAIQATHLALGHRLTVGRMDKRLANGLRFLRFELEGQPVASTWAAGQEGRYIDELNWLMPLGPHEFWVRDVFVAPVCRGRRLLSHIAHALAVLGGNGPCRVWSDVDWENEQSVRAHQSAGFRTVARVRSFDIGGRVRVRSRLPDWSPPVREIDPLSRCVWLRGDKWVRHQELIA